MVKALNRPKAALIVAAVASAGVLLGAWALLGRSDRPEDLLRSDSPARRREGISALRAKRDTPEGIRRLARAARSKKTAVACMALRAVAAGHRPDKPMKPQALEIVKKAAADPRPQVKHTSIRILEATTPPAPEDTAVPALLLDVFVKETAPQTRAPSANALGKLKYWPAMEPLLDALEDDSVVVRGAAGAAIREILGLDYGFRAGDPSSQRASVVARMKQQWRIQLPFYLDYVKRLRQARKAKP